MLDDDTILRCLIAIDREVGSLCEIVQRQVRSNLLRKSDMLEERVPDDVSPAGVDRAGACSYRGFVTWLANAPNHKIPFTQVRGPRFRHKLPLLEARSTPFPRSSAYRYNLFAFL
jgi:hypothetical protein